jgi:alanine racemase
MQMDQLTTWLEIDLGAIKNNIRELRSIAGVPLMAVVKANGYGHGLIEIAKAAQEAGAAWCGVARIEEALALRQSSIDLPVLVLGYTSPSRVREAVENHLSLSVYDLDVARAYSDEARSCGGILQVHAKVDSGMGRLGIFPEEGMGFIQALHRLPGLEVTGLFTHFARADETIRQTTLEQIERFQNLVDCLSQVGLRPPIVHACNSAGTIYFPEAHYDLVRCGISIYGLHPSSEAPNPASLRPALTWKARLSSVKYFPPGHGISYNYRYTTTRRERIGAVAAGYADGFRRRLGNFALVNGQRVDIVGGVCMDQIMLQLDDVPDARIGDEVVLLGKQGSAVITAEEIADAWGTNNYEVVCGLASRLPRIYFD